jgi:hypothetical protein
VGGRYVCVCVRSTAVGYSPAGGSKSDAGTTGTLSACSEPLELECPDKGVWSWSRGDRPAAQHWRAEQMSDRGFAIFRGRRR